MMFQHTTPVFFRRLHVVGGALVAALLFVASCGGEEPGAWPFGDPSESASLGKADRVSENYSLVTYNAGLAHGAVALADERLPAVIDALAKTPADVLCLNEVWTDDDVEAVTRGLAHLYPYSFRKRTVDTSAKSAPCGVWNTVMLDRCVTSKCSDEGISAEECVAPGGPCSARYGSLDDACKLCLAANTVGAWHCAAFGAKAYANKGRNGLLLLSRRPLKNAHYTPFETLLVKRGVITADIDGHTVQCTHMTSDLPVVPYPKNKGTFASWAEEHLAELDVIEGQQMPGRCTVLLGDLNAGLPTTTLQGELPENFLRFLDAGYVEPWDDERCTWCDDNPLAGSTVNKRFDHILLRDCPGDAVYHYQRVLDEPISLGSGSDILTTRLSDHYGLKVTIQPSVVPAS